jgi:hypothetical protein
MQQWTEIRRRVLTGEISKRTACREYELGWHTLKKILEHDSPPGYRLSQPRPKLEPFLPIIEQMLTAFQSGGAGRSDLPCVLIDSKVQHNCGSPVRKKGCETPTAIGEPLLSLKNHSFMDIRDGIET